MRFSLLVMLLFIGFHQPADATEIQDITAKSSHSNSRTEMTKEEKSAPLPDSFSLAELLDMAERGHPVAQMKLGYFYATGEYLEQNPEKSFVWSMKAAKQGNAKAQYNVAINYAKGIGVEKSRAKADEWMAKAAKSGSEDAQKIVHMEDSASTHRNAVPYIDAFKEKAEEGDADMAYKLGEIYTKGQGVPRDRMQGYAWYEKAANLGHAEAQFIMGSANLEHISKQKMFDWMLMAAKNGHARAQYNMAIFYGTADETPFDIKESYAWMRAAQANGMSHDQKDIETMERQVSLFRNEADELAESYIQKYGKK